LVIRRRPLGAVLTWANALRWSVYRERENSKKANIFYTFIDNTEIPTSFKDLIGFLQNNGRLEKPSLMPNPVSDLMMKCWDNDPKERPDFSQLKTELGNMLEDDVHKHFLKMMDRP